MPFLKPSQMLALQIAAKEDRQIGQELFDDVEGVSLEDLTEALDMNPVTGTIDKGTGDIVYVNGVFVSLDDVLEVEPIERP